MEPTIVQGPFPCPSVDGRTEDVRSAYNYLAKHNLGGCVLPGVSLNLKQGMLTRDPAGMVITVDWTKIPKELDFRKAWQWFDYRPFHKHPRLCRKVGNCVTCGRSCHTFHDGADDPRGPLGEHSCQGKGPNQISNWYDLSKELREQLDRIQVPQCSLCDSEEPKNRRANRIARRRFERFARRFKTETLEFYTN